MAIEIVDLPIDSMVIFHSYVSLPEGNQPITFPLLIHIFNPIFAGDTHCH